MTRRSEDERVWQEETSPTYRRFLVLDEKATGIECRADQVRLNGNPGTYCTEMGIGVYCDKYDEAATAQCVHTMLCSPYGGVDCPGVGIPQTTGGFANAGDNEARIKQLLERETATITQPKKVCVAIGDEDDTCKSNVVQ